MECKYCKFSCRDDGGSKMCSNEYLIKFMGWPTRCDIYNPLGACKEGELNFRGLVKKLLEDIHILKRAQDEK